MFHLLKISSILGPSVRVRFDDTLRTKIVLNRLGYYKPTKVGITRYPDQQLFEGLKMFQADQGLYQDGIMKPNGPTIKRLNHSLLRSSGIRRSAEIPVSMARSKSALTAIEKVGISDRDKDLCDDRYRRELQKMRPLARYMA